MEWLLFSLIVVFLSAGLNLLMRTLAVDSVNPRAFSLIFNLWASGFAVILFILLANKSFVAPSLGIIFLIIVSSALYGIFERYQFQARKGVEASRTAIVFRSSTVITFVGSILIFNESITFEKVLGFILILIATIVVSLNGAKLKIDNAFKLTILSAFALGLGRIVDKGVLSSEFPLELYNLILWIAPIFFIVLPFIPMKEIKKEIFIGGWKIPLIALINVAILYFLLKAISLADASLVIAITSASTIFTVLGGVIILKEKGNLKGKIISGFVVFIGIILLSW